MGLEGSSRRLQWPPSRLLTARMVKRMGSVVQENGREMTRQNHQSLGGKMPSPNPRPWRVCIESNSSSAFLYEVSSPALGGFCTSIPELVDSPQSTQTPPPHIQPGPHLQPLVEPDPAHPPASLGRTLAGWPSRGLLPRSGAEGRRAQERLRRSPGLPPAASASHDR